MLVMGCGNSWKVTPPTDFPLKPDDIDAAHGPCRRGGDREQLLAMRGVVVFDWRR